VTPKRTLIIGLGRDGISLAMALRAGGARVAGYDADPAVRDTALTAKAVDEALDRMDRIDDSVDLVVLALPAIQAPDAIARVAPLLPERTILMDLAPIMLPSVAAASSAGILPRFVPAHPVPSAPDASPDSARFRGASVLIGSSLDPGSPGATVAGLWSSIGALPAGVAPTLHDALFALTHDLSILSSAALVRTLRRTGSLTRLLAPASRAVLDDATRPAASAPSAETLAINAPKLVPALELLEREVRRLRHALAEGGPELGSLLDEARQFRQELVR
jgi:cyclohexadieny/prephenate dehydrogenase